MDEPNTTEPHTSRGSVTKVTLCDFYNNKKLPKSWRNLSFLWASQRKKREEKHDFLGCWGSGGCVCPSATSQSVAVAGLLSKDSYEGSGFGFASGSRAAGSGGAGPEDDRGLLRSTDFCHYCY